MYDKYIYKEHSNVQKKTFSRDENKIFDSEKMGRI